MIEYHYQNHYSVTLNKCFFLVIVITINKNKSSVSTVMRLFDLNEHKQYAMFYMESDRPLNEGYGTFEGSAYSAPFPCKWNEQHKACHSESEWQEWLKPYMEE